MIVVRVVSVTSLLAIAVWLGGLIALGAIAAPVVFSSVPIREAADAMTLVFRRFDTVAMVCAAVLLLGEAARATGHRFFTRIDLTRAVVSVAASIAAVVQGIQISPRIAELHARGVSRGLGDAGRELARWHERAELCGQVQVVLLALAVTLHVLALSRSRPVR
jgi:hypothetical protein